MSANQQRLHMKGKKRLNSMSENTLTNSSATADHQRGENPPKPDSPDGANAKRETETKRTKRTKADSRQPTPEAHQEPPKAMAEEDIKPSYEAADTHDPQPTTPLDEERCSDYRVWKAEYLKLKETHRRQEEETAKELKSLKEKLETTESAYDRLEWDGFLEEKRRYPQRFGKPLEAKKVRNGYQDINTNIDLICGELQHHVVPSTLLNASEDPELWLIAREGGEPWLQGLLAEFEHEEYSRIPNWIMQRLIMRYILRYIFEPMLVGLDRDLELLLVKVKDNMESRMLPSVVDRWMSEALVSYTQLPKYDGDRDYYLHGHAQFIRKFLEHFVPDSETPPKTAGEMRVARSFEKIHEKITAPAANLAAELSLSYMKYEVDWAYCEKKTELLYEEMKTHKVFHVNGIQIYHLNFPKVGHGGKVGDVVMYVRPPIFVYDRVTPRRMYGLPLVVIRPVPSFDPEGDLKVPLGAY
ncbi:hypothetical protein FQN54_007908 [Arachnomyces sp. PD_36]|nr:hypothetical protein FQN54_007908 [Arachnomyces sp. PD_36]